MDIKTEGQHPQAVVKSYELLEKYMDEAKVNASAYSMSERYFRKMAKWLTYPIIITSAVATICATIPQVSQYVLLGLSLVTLILSGFNQAIKPEHKSHEAHNVAIEFNEIHKNVQQFLYENGKTLAEIKAYTQHVRDILNIWISQSPEIRQVYIKRATNESIKRLRPSQKKIGSNEPM